ncbi:hypothetical protein V493_06895 [Pseudogymnoascus sp. VKM F-4281 (FW-2241)]|nr:hypothetical protein V493_06895 [Pseudogymnoascus sp. VKM F-4281 (FW-2241)]
MATTPPQPFWLQIVRGFQLLLALVTLGLSAYALSVVGGYSGYGLNIFTTIVTLFYIAYIVTSSFIVPTLYNIWTSLALQAFLCIFWLATFGTLAAASVAYSIDDAFDYYDNDEWFYSVHTGDYVSAETAKVVVNTTKASAALTAFIWVSFVATLIYTTLSAIRHGRGNRAGAAPAPAANQEHKMGPVGGPTPTSYQPVEQYAQQPQYAAPYAAPGAEYPQQQQQFQQQPMGYAPQQFQQPTAYPQQTGSPAPYQPTGSPAPYQQAGSPAPGAYVQQAPYPPQQLSA